MSSCAKETCIHSSVCMYFADRCITNGDCENFKPPQPKRPHGMWIKDDWVRDLTGEFHRQYTCSECGYQVIKRHPFCVCGADMREGEEK